MMSEALKASDRKIRRGGLPGEELIERLSSRTPHDDWQLEAFSEVRNAAANFWSTVLINSPEGRERSEAFINIEQAAMWANKAISRGE